MLSAKLYIKGLFFGVGNLVLKLKKREHVPCGGLHVWPDIIISPTKQ